MSARCARSKSSPYWNSTMATCLPLCLLFEQRNGSEPTVCLLPTPTARRLRLSLVAGVSAEVAVEGLRNERQPVDSTDPASCAVLTAGEGGFAEPVAEIGRRGDWGAEH